MDALYINDPDAIVTAAWHGEYEILTYLLANGASIETQDDAGNTPLIAATEQGYFGLVKFLVEQGANINAQDTDGDTALDIAQFNNDQEIVNFLLANGATKKDSPSAKEKMWDPIYDAFEQANAVKRLNREIQKKTE